MTTRPTIAVAIHDGFYGCGTGAGYANLGFLHTLVSMLPASVRLVVMPVLIDPASPEHHPGWHRHARALLAGAQILPVDNGTHGRDRWGGLDHFQHLVHSTARRLRGVHDTADPLLVLAFDAPFLGLGAALPPALLPDLVLAPRSSAAIHTPHDRARRDWERRGLLAGVAGGAKVATISRFMADHLHDVYDVPREAMVALPDGLTHREWDRLDSPVLDAPAQEFVLAMGRAEPYKGFDDLLDAWRILHNKHAPLPLLALAATTEGTPTAYQRALRRKAGTLGSPVHLLTRFTPAITGLLRHPGLLATVVPSHAEPFGRVPMEAFAAGASPVITTTRHGLGGQVLPGRTGFLSQAGSPRSLARALGQALDLSPDQRFLMRQRARQSALRDYDHPAAVRCFLAHTAAWLDLPDPDDQLRWLSTAAPTRSRRPVSTVPPVKVPIGLQARHWTTVRPGRRVLVVAHHVTSLLRLLDILPVFDSDPRIQIVFTWNGSDPFSHGLHQYLDHLGVIVIPWTQAIDIEFDLTIAANHGGLTETSHPLVILPHGVGYTKQSPGEPENRRTGEPENRRTGACSGCLRNGCSTMVGRLRRRSCWRTRPSVPVWRRSHRLRPIRRWWPGILPTTGWCEAGTCVTGTAALWVLHRTRRW